MADPNASPALPSTADTTPYVPISMMAVTAIVVAGVFLLCLVVFGASAYFGKKPLVMPELLALAVIGLVLSFAARRVIRNSEGTRTGTRLAEVAWWLCVVGGLGYFAYLIAIEFSIRRDAESEVQQWIDFLKKDDINSAFVRTIEPGRRTNINPALLKVDFREPYTAFSQCDVVRLAQRNKGELEFVPGGLKDWVQRPTGVECVFVGALKCPEGRFPINVPLRAVTGVRGPSDHAAGRRWQIVLAQGQGGFVVRENTTLTPYGWLVVTLEQSGVEFASGFFVESATKQAAALYQLRIRPNSDAKFWTTVSDSSAGRAALGGGPSIAAPYMTADYAKYMADEFFKLPGGGNPSDDQKRTFQTIWNMFGVFPPGTRIRDSADIHAVLSVTDSAVEVRIPCELPSLGTDGNLAAARGRLVIACTDPAVLAELKRLKAEARPDEGTAMPVTPTVHPAWRVIRIESDLHTVQPPRGPGGPGGPGGP